MSTRTKIMVCGDAGPARHALLPRGDIEMIWTDSVESALAVVRSVRPKVCLIRGKLEKGSVPELLRGIRAENGPASIVLLQADEWRLRGDLLGSGADEIVEIDRSQAVLQLIGQYTGLAFAQDARVAYKTPVRLLG